MSHLCPVSPVSTHLPPPQRVTPTDSSGGRFSSWPSDALSSSQSSCCAGGDEPGSREPTRRSNSPWQRSWTILVAGNNASSDSARGCSDTPRRTSSPDITLTPQTHEVIPEITRGEISHCEISRSRGSGEMISNGRRHTTTTTTSMESLMPTNTNRRPGPVPQNIADTIAANPPTTLPRSSSESIAACDERNPERSSWRASRVSRYILRSLAPPRGLQTRGFRPRVCLVRDSLCLAAVEVAIEVGR